jgi:hypothetical protein
MKKMSSLTVKISSKVKSDLKDMSKRVHMNINELVEEAIKLHVRSIKTSIKLSKEDIAVFKEYEKHGKKTLTNYDDFAKSISLRNKKKAKKK